MNLFLNFGYEGKGDDLERARVDRAGRLLRSLRGTLACSLAACKKGTQSRRPFSAMTSQGSAHGRFTRAIQHRNLWAKEMSMRELGHPPTLESALAYLDLLAEQKPEKLERAAVRWHGRLETEAPLLTLAGRSSPLRLRGGAGRPAP